MCENPAAFLLVPDCFKTQEMCIKAVEVDPWQQKDVPDHFKTKNMCDDVAWGDPFSLGFVLDWFVTQEQVNYDMIMMIIMMITNLLNGTMVIKSARPGKRK